MIEKIKFVHVLTVLAIAIATVIAFRVMFSEDFADSELRTQVVTAALGMLAAATGYWINSSSDSQKKTDMIAKSTQLPEKDDNL